MSKTDDERMADFVAKQVERVKDKQKDDIGEKVDESNYTELQRSEDRIKLDTLKLEKKDEFEPKIIEVNNSLILKQKKKIKRSNNSDCDVNISKKKKSAIEEIIEEEQKEKEIKEMRLREKQENPWLKSRIVIKITSKKFGDKYYKQKAEVLEVIYKFKALVKLIQDGSKITVDQNEIETVIPAVGRQVLILQGRFRGKTAVLCLLDAM